MLYTRKFNSAPASTIPRFLGSLDHRIVWGPPSIILRGAYAYFLEHYRKYFPRENMLVLNTDDLKKEPARLTIETQKFLGVPVTVDERNFVFNQTSGQYCTIGEAPDRPVCMRDKKNRSHDKSMDADTAMKLGRVYKALKPDLDDWVGKGQFDSWTYDEY